MGRWGVILVLLLALGLAGCGPSLQQQVAKTNAQLQTLVGVQDFDFFVAKMGPPTAQTDLGSKIVAQWTANSTYTIKTTNFAVPMNSGERLTAEFDKSTKLLTSARFEKW